MSAARAGGHRGQGTIEFVLILPLLILMLVAIADYAREKVTVKVVKDVPCLFPLKSLGVKGATDAGWQVHSETSSIRSEIRRS